MKYLCSGGRFFNDKRAVEDIVDNFDCIFDSVIHGACPTGADQLVDDRAKEWNIETHRFPARNSDGWPQAGPLRNQRMLDEGKPDFAYFFWNGISSGTFDCLVRVLKARIPHEVITQTGCKESVREGYLKAINKAFGKQGQLF